MKGKYTEFAILLQVLTLPFNDNFQREVNRRKFADILAV